MHERILVSGALGYIGSHTVIALAEASYQPILLDNLSNSKLAVWERLTEHLGYRPPFYQLDAADYEGVRALFRKEKPQAIIHFAAYKAVGESVREPLKYYRNNLSTSLNLLRLMKEESVQTLIFSSSATVYGEAETMPLTEDMPLSCTNPYGWTKWMNEQFLRDIGQANPNLSLINLRYFNPVGAHPSGRFGEDPKGVPNNLMPYISKVAIGELPYLHIFGQDYPTSDGTGVRDYIHVCDLAEGHVAALSYALEHPGTRAINLGSGRGTSVLELVQSFSKVNGVTVPYQFEARRPGDVAVCYADPSLAAELLHWRSRRSVEDMCRDSWRWQQANPQGYED